MREVYAATPTQLRAAANGSRPATDAGLIGLRLPVRQPFDGAGLLSFLAARAVPGVEEVTPGRYRRSVRLAHGHGVITLEPADDHVRCELLLADLRDLASAIERSRRMLDLDADPTAISDALGDDPALAPLVRRRPGVRVPGHVDGAEIAVRAILGQQISVGHARALAQRLATDHGGRLDRPHGGVSLLFPAADALAGADPARLGVPAARGRAIVLVCEALASGQIRLDRGADRAEVRAQLLAVPGIGPWTADYIALRALGDPDVFLPGDVGVRKAMAALRLADTPSAVERYAERWRPWRSYALMHLWHHITDDPSSPTDREER